MVNETNARLTKRRDGKYLMYLPKSLVEDSMFPFKVESSVEVKIGFKIGEKKLTIEEPK